MKMTQTGVKLVKNRHQNVKFWEQARQADAPSGCSLKAHNRKREDVSLATSPQNYLKRFMNQSFQSG